MSSSILPFNSYGLLWRPTFSFISENRCGVCLLRFPSRNYDFRLHLDGISYWESRKYDFRVQREVAYVTRWIRLRFDSRATCVYRMGVVLSQSRRNCNKDCLGGHLGETGGDVPPTAWGGGDELLIPPIFCKHKQVDCLIDSPVV